MTDLDLATVAIAAPPAVVLDALRRLNAHARAYGDGKRAIYEYKALACAVALLAGEASAQLRQWTGTCGQCGGTGRYVDSCGYRFPHCRACASSGRVTLRFVEVLVADGNWHHPFESSAGQHLARLAGLAVWNSERGGWRNADGAEPVFWNITDGWAPRQPGARLDPDALAVALNVVEAWVLSLKVPDSAQWLRERARYAMLCYGIDLGRLPGGCYRCGAPADIGLGHGSRPFSFATPACRAHGNCAIAHWPKFLPESVLTPALREWRDRHVALGFAEDRW